MQQIILTWFMSFIVSVAPPERSASRTRGESAEEATARYESISKDVFDVVYNEENPTLFQGPQGRAKTAALILSVMWFESQFRQDVDQGVVKGDHGRSFCLMQVQTGTKKTWAWNATKHRFAVKGDPPEEVQQGWTGDELTEDRQKCVLAGLRIMDMSFNACRALPVKERLRVYASGSSTMGSKESNHRVGLAIRWFTAHRAPMTDDEVFATLKEADPTEEGPGVEDTLIYSPATAAWSGVGGQSASSLMRSTYLGLGYSL